MNKLKFAIIGCGRIAGRHADIIKSIGELAAVCDEKKTIADEFGKKYFVKSYTDHTKLLKETEADVITIASPNGLHALHTIDSLNAGRNVICEKPMATKIEDCKRMIDNADKTGKKLFIVKQNRFNPPIEALKNAIVSGKLGKILSVELNCFWNRSKEYYENSDWKGTKDLDGGTLFTQFSHFIDLLYWLVGDVNKVFAMSNNFAHKGITDYEDTGVVALQFENGALGTINYTVNSYKKNMEGSITVFGEKGTVKVGGQYLNVLEYQSIEGFEISGLPQSRPANDYGFYQGSMSNHERVYDNVIDVLQRGGKIAATAYDGMKTVEIIEKIYRSSVVNGQ